MKTDFRPPRGKRWFIRLVYALLPLISRLWRGIERVEIASEDLDRLGALRRERFLLCSNHPTLGDPLVIGELGRRLGISFNYMAARDIFTGILGWMLQSGGAYSVLRGAPDREAVRETRRLLAHEDRKIVVFPEGLTYGHNDLLLPFQGGVIQIGFWALEDLEKLGKEIRLPLVPVAIKYLFVSDARAAIDASLNSLEHALALVPAAGESFYPRLQAVGMQIIGQMEQEFGLAPAPGTPLAERILAAKRHVLERTARVLDVRVPSSASHSEQLHVLDNALAAYVREYAESTEEEEQRLHARRREIAEPLARDLRRLHNFIAMTDNYLASAPTAERFLEVLGRFEVEVLGRSQRRGRYHAIVQVGEPLELSTYLGQYGQSKRAAVAAATADLERRIAELLQPMSALGTPMDAA